MRRGTGILPVGTARSCRQRSLIVRRCGRWWNATSGRVGESKCSPRPRAAQPEASRSENAIHPMRHAGCSAHWHRVRDNPIHQGSAVARASCPRGVGDRFRQRGLISRRWIAHPGGARLRFRNRARPAYPGPSQSPRTGCPCQNGSGGDPGYSRSKRRDGDKVIGNSGVGAFTCLIFDRVGSSAHLANCLSRLEKSLARLLGFRYEIVVVVIYSTQPRRRPKKTSAGRLPTPDFSKS